MIIRHNPQLPPTIHHRQQTELTILYPLRRLLSQTKPIEQIILQQQLILAILLRLPEYSCPGGVDPLRECFPMPTKHEFEQLRDTLSILPYLLPSRRVQDSQTGVDVPFIRVDAQHKIDLHVLDPTDVARDLPRELVVGLPGGAHGEECGVRDCLGVGGDAVVLFGGEVDKVGLEAGQDLLDESDSSVRGAVLDYDEGLAFGIDAGAVKGVAGDDLDVGGEVRFEGRDLGGFGRGLAADYSALFGRGSVGRDYGVDGLGFDTVHDPVGATRDEVAIGKDGYVFLLILSACYLWLCTDDEVARTRSEKSALSDAYLSGTSQACTLVSVSTWEAVGSEHRVSLCFFATCAEQS